LINRNSTGKEEDTTEFGTTMSSIHKEIEDHKTQLASTKSVKDEHQHKKELLGHAIREASTANQWDDDDETTPSPSPAPEDTPDRRKKKPTKRQRMSANMAQMQSSIGSLSSISDRQWELENKKFEVQTQLEREKLELQKKQLEADSVERRDMIQLQREQMQLRSQQQKEQLQQQREQNDNTQKTMMAVIELLRSGLISSDKKSV